MGISVEWIRSPSGEYQVTASGEGVSVRIQTKNLGYASKLTALILDSEPAAFVPPEPIPELKPAMSALAERIESAEEGEPIPKPLDEALSQ